MARYLEKKNAQRKNMNKREKGYFENTLKITRLNKEIQQMYRELEQQYNNNGLIELENQLKKDVQRLRVAYEETKVNFAIKENQ